MSETEKIVLYERAEHDRSPLPEVQDGDNVLFAESGLSATAYNIAGQLLVCDTPDGTVVADLSGLTCTPPRPA